MGAPQPPCPSPPGSGNNLSVPLHRSPSPAAAIAATTMPKRKKQNQQQQLTLDPQVPKREEIGDEDDEIPTGPPSLPGPPPMANGKPSDPKSAPNWNLPTCPPSVEWINKLCILAIGYYTAMKMNSCCRQPG